MRRVFFALEVTPRNREALAEVGGALRAHPAAARVRLRFTHHEDFHATLKFVGNAADEVVDALLERMKALGMPELPLASSWAGLTAFPSEGHARVLVARATDPNGEVEALARVFEDTCAECGIPRETRPYRPHVTLARLRYPQRVQELCKIPLSGECSLGPVVLYESHLSPAGSRYLPLWKSG